MKYAAPSVVRLTPKHGLKDCVVAALSAYYDKPYEEVVAAAGRAYKNFHKIGLENKHVETVLRRLGVRGRWVRDFDLEEDSGVLAINYIVGTNEHVVLLLDGHIYELEDSPVTRWDADAYLTVHGARAGLLLVRDAP